MIVLILVLLFIMSNSNCSSKSISDVQNTFELSGDMHI